MVTTTVPSPTVRTKPRSYHPDDFLPLMTVVQRHASVVFRGLPQVEREEAIAEAVASAFVAYRRLCDRGIDPVREFPSMMATFAVRQVRDGRHVGSRMSSKDVLSARAQRKHGFHVQSLPISTRRPHEDVHSAVSGQRVMDSFEERLHENRRTPVPEQAAFRIDWPEFMRSLSQRDRRLATYLSMGNSAKQAAERFRVSQGRVTQLRQGWCREWHRMNDEQSPLDQRHETRKAKAS
jgi:hypothetical protein